MTFALRSVYETSKFTHDEKNNHHYSSCAYDFPNKYKYFPQYNVIVHDWRTAVESTRASSTMLDEF